MPFCNLSFQECCDKIVAFLGLCILIGVFGGVVYVLLYALGIALQVVEKGYHS